MPEKVVGTYNRFFRENKMKTGNSNRKRRGCCNENNYDLGSRLRKRINKQEENTDNTDDDLR